jgi:hypothetical protein
MIGFPIDIMQELRGISENSKVINDVDFSVRDKDPEGTMQVINDLDDTNIWHCLAIFGGFSMLPDNRAPLDNMVLQICRDFYTKDVPDTAKIDLLLWIAYWSDYMASDYIKQICKEVLIKTNLPNLDFQHITDHEIMRLYAKDNWKYLGIDNCTKEV